MKQWFLPSNTEISNKYKRNNFIEHIKTERYAAFIEETKKEMPCIYEVHDNKNHYLLMHVAGYSQLLSDYKTNRQDLYNQILVSYSLPLESVLVHEENNKYDKQALRIDILHGPNSIGYISRPYNEIILEQYERIERVWLTAISENINGKFLVPVIKINIKHSLQQSIQRNRFVALMREE